MERRKYIAELVARTGVQVDENDPVFAVVLLNRLILEDQKSELETLVEQLSKTGKAINGEVVKQAQTLWDTKTRQLHAEAAELKAAMLREHAEVLESTRKAIRQEIGEAMGQVARSTVETNRSIWTASLVSGVTSGVVAGLAVFLLL
jgi:F0F1-type ATP synthase membrane subunit b/b'